MREVTIKSILQGTLILFILLLETLILVIPTMPLVLWLRSNICATFISRLFIRIFLYSYRMIYRTKFVINGIDDIKAGDILVSKHQSIWETLIFFIDKRAICVMKEEIFNLPIYGQYCRKSCATIAVRRNGGILSAKKMIQDIRYALDSGKYVVIFPQGTRVPIGGKKEDFPYHWIVSTLYKSCYRFRPVALNSGLFWTKGIFTKKISGQIEMHIMEPISIDLSINELKEKLEDMIEKKTDALVYNAILYEKTKII